MAFWKPGTVAPGSSLDRESDDGGNTVVHNPLAAMPLEQQRRMLPIFQVRTQFLYLVEKYNTVIVVGQTGCGKSTQVPQYLHESGWTAGGRVVCCTQPRRIAAMSVAGRVAEERGVHLGNEVGYSIRFDDKSDPVNTRIKYVTDGMLIREMMLDPLLRRYGAIMLDEAHERSLSTDILLGLLKKVQRKRKDLRLIISSATVDAEEFKEFFETNTTDDESKDSVSILSIEGRMYPVEINYLAAPSADYLESTVETILSIHKTEGPGDILAFLTGQEEIETVCDLLKEQSVALRHKFLNMTVLPLYSGLPAEQQMKVFETTRVGHRKIIIATNIAETSLTVDGIVYVVDCGFVKEKSYNPRSGMDCLLVQPLSRASANQRCGRAGRVRPGKCYRLYTENDFLSMMKAKPVPEMQRTNLMSVVLQLKALGIDDILHFDFMSPPPAESMIRALEILYALGALDDNCRLSNPLGNQMAEFPVEPMLAKMLLSSGEMFCSEEILTIAAMCSVQSIWVYPKDIRTALNAAKRYFAVHEGDHLTLLNVYNAFKAKKRDVPAWCKENYLNYKILLRAQEIRSQLGRFMKRFQVPMMSCDGDITKLRRCIVSGFFPHAAQRQGDGSYKTVKEGHTIYLHPTSILFKSAPEWVVYHEVVLTHKQLMREVTTIDPLWLTELAPHYYEYQKPKISRPCGNDHPDARPAKIQRSAF